MLSRGCHYIGSYFIITQVESLQGCYFIIAFNVQSIAEGQDLEIQNLKIV